MEMTLTHLIIRSVQILMAMTVMTAQAEVMIQMQMEMTMIMMAHVTQVTLFLLKA